MRLNKLRGAHVKPQHKVKFQGTHGGRNQAKNNVVHSPRPRSAEEFLKQKNMCDSFCNVFGPQMWFTFESDAVHLPPT